MASLNFPDTSGSPPTDGSFTHTENGLVYSWDGEKWTLVNESDGAGSDYVLPTATAIRLGGIKVGENLSVEPDGTLNAAGDDSIPTLQEVTDAGNTTTNGATFASDVTVKNSSTDGKSVLGEHGALYLTRATSNNDAAIRLTSDGDKKLSILADGSADFAGEVSVDRTAQGWSFLQKWTGNNYGGLFVAAGGNSLILSDGTTNKVEIKGIDGSADFAGNVDVAVGKRFQSGEGTFNANANPGVFLGTQNEGTYSGSANLLLLSNYYSPNNNPNNYFLCFGSADGTSNPKVRRFLVKTDGELRISDDSSGAYANPKVTLSPDGSAEFAGEVTIGGTVIRPGGTAFFVDDIYVGADPTAGANVGASVKSEGYVEVTAGADDPLFVGNQAGDGGGETVRITGKGSAEFAGTVKCYSPGQGVESYNGFFSRCTSTSLPSETTTGGALGSGYIRVSTASGSPSSHAVFSSFLTTDGEEKIRMTGNGDGSFCAERVELLSIGDTGTLGLRKTGGNQTYLNAKGNGILAITARQAEINAGTEPIVFYADEGAASFGSTIIHKGWVDDSTPGFRVTSGSDGTQVGIKGNGSAFGALTIRANGTDVTDEVLVLKGDGGAVFAVGQAVIQADAASQFVRAVDDTSNIAVQHWIRGGYKTPGGNNVYTANINCDGSASFANKVEVSFSDTVNAAFIATNTAADGSPLWQGYNTDEETSRIGNDGIASFAAQVQTFKYFWSRNEGAPSNDNSTGGLYLYNNDPGSSGTRSDAAVVISPTSTNNGNTIKFNYDGSASFALNGVFAGGVRAGALDAGAPSTGVTGSNLGEAGQITATAASGNVFAGRTTGDTAVTSSIGADGSASFAAGNVILGPDAGGYFIVGGNPANGVSEGASLSGSGQVTVAAENDNDSLWQGYKVGAGAGNYSSVIGADGYASFAGGSVQISASGAISSDRTDGTRDCFVGQLNGTATSQIKADGSASFAGSIVSGNATTSTDYLRYTPGVNNLQIRNTSDEPTVLLYQDNVAAPTVIIEKDGSADFASTITVGKHDSQGDNIILSTRQGYSTLSTAYSSGSMILGYGCYGGGDVNEFKSSAELSLQRAAYSQSGRSGNGGHSWYAESSTTDTAVGSVVTMKRQMWLHNSQGNLYLGGDLENDSVNLNAPNITLNGNGSASFSGNIQAGGQPSDGTAIGVRVNAYGSIMTCRDTAEDTVFVGYLQGNTTTTSRINADGSASFAGNIQAAGLTDGTTTKTMTEVLSGGGQSSASAWGRVAGDGTLQRGFNIDSVTRDSNGNYTVVFDEALGGDDYAVLLSVGAVNLSQNSECRVNTSSTSTTGFTYQVATSTGWADLPVSFTVFY